MISVNMNVHLLRDRRFQNFAGKLCNEIHDMPPLKSEVAWGNSAFTSSAVFAFNKQKSTRYRKRAIIEQIKKPK